VLGHHAQNQGTTVLILCAL